MNEDINKEQIQLAYLVWLFILGILVYSNFFNPSIQANENAIFGSKPYGIPLAIFMSILQTVFLLPMIPVLKHFTVLIVRARGQGSGLQLISILSYAIRDSKSKHAMVICIMGFIYFLVLMYFWVTYFAPATK
jgi:hypothetical protein